LLFNLGGTRTVRSVTIATPNPGFTVELRTAGAGASDLAATTKVGGGTVDSTETTLSIATATAAPFMLVWITALAPSQQTSGQYEATVQKVTMKS
jgi:putative peptidoglycan lipid II flippase